MNVIYFVRPVEKGCTDEDFQPVLASGEEDAIEKFFKMFGPEDLDADVLVREGEDGPVHAYTVEIECAPRFYIQRNYEMESK